VRQLSLLHPLGSQVGGSGDTLAKKVLGNSHLIRLIPTRISISAGKRGNLFAVFSALDASFATTKITLVFQTVPHF
jgi:hypothetical protein